MVGGADLVCVLVPTDFSPPASYEYIHPHVDTATATGRCGIALAVARLAGDGHVNTICRGMNH